MKRILSIAGSDSSGGAGIQADLKTFTMYGMYGMTAITALTAQNTTGVFDVVESTPSFVQAQIESVFTDIRPDAVKIGMVANKEIIEMIAKELRRFEATNIVVDPVMVATSGSNLIQSDAMEALIQHLFPIASIVTPNIYEAQLLSGITIHTKVDMLEAAYQIRKTTDAHILIKGGHLVESADDLLLVENEAYWFESERIQNENTHGTGCTLSSALACELARNKSPFESVRDAKAYVYGAIKSNLNLGKGSGPLNHMYQWKQTTSF